MLRWPKTRATKTIENLRFHRGLQHCENITSLLDFLDCSFPNYSFVWISPLFHVRLIHPLTRVLIADKRAWCSLFSVFFLIKDRLLPYKAVVYLHCISLATKCTKSFLRSNWARFLSCFCSSPKRRGLRTLGTIDLHVAAHVNHLLHALLIFPSTCSARYGPPSKVTPRWASGPKRHESSLCSHAEFDQSKARICQTWNDLFFQFFKTSLVK